LCIKPMHQPYQEELWWTIFHYEVSRTVDTKGERE
jgi:hypothetical protein